MRSLLVQGAVQTKKVVREQQNSDMQGSLQMHVGRYLNSMWDDFTVAFASGQMNEVKIVAATLSSSALQICRHIIM